MIASADLDKMINDAHAYGREEEYDAFSDEIESLSTEELRQILPLLGVVFSDPSTVDRVDALLAMNETTWREYFVAFHRITRRSSSLDLETSRG
jgi:hypothetical protein